MTLYQAIQAFDAADAIWQAALVDAFGKRASLMRYKPEGRGIVGPLRLAYEHREAARREYERAWNAYFKEQRDQ